VGVRCRFEPGFSSISVCLSPFRRPRHDSRMVEGGEKAGREPPDLRIIGRPHPNPNSSREVASSPIVLTSNPRRKEKRTLCTSTHASLVKSNASSFQCARESAFFCKSIGGNIIIIIVSYAAWLCQPRTSTYVSYFCDNLCVSTYASPILISASSKFLCSHNLLIDL